MSDGGETRGGICPGGAPPGDPTVEPAVVNSPEVAPVSAPDSAVFPVSDMTGTGAQTPSVVADGAPKGAPNGETPATVPDAQAALCTL